MMRIFIRKRTNKFRNILAFFGKCKKTTTDVAPADIALCFLA